MVIKLGNKLEATCSVEAYGVSVKPVKLRSLDIILMSKGFMQIEL